MTVAELIEELDGFGETARPSGEGTGMVKYPDVTVELVGQDGNAFSIIGRVRRELRRAKGDEIASEFAKAAFAAQSYDALLQLVMTWVEVA